MAWVENGVSVFSQRSVSVSWVRNIGSPFSVPQWTPAATDGPDLDPRFRDDRVSIRGHEFVQHWIPVGTTGRLPRLRVPGAVHSTYPSPLIVERHDERAV